MRASHRMLTWLLAVIACDGSVAPVRVTLSAGTFVLERVDGAPLPQRVARAGGDSSDVHGGSLVLNLTTARASFSLWSVRSDGRDVVESFSMPLRVVAPDSFTAIQWRGRAWGDTAEMRTNAAPFGTHLMRLVRVGEP